MARRCKEAFISRLAAAPAAAKASLQSAVTGCRPHPRTAKPDLIVIDGSQTNHEAIRSCGAESRYAELRACHRSPLQRVWTRIYAQGRNACKPLERNLGWLVHQRLLSCRWLVGDHQPDCIGVHGDRNPEVDRDLAVINARHVPSKLDLLAVCHLRRSINNRVRAVHRMGSIRSPGPL